MRRPQNLKQSPTCFDKTVLWPFQKKWTLKLNKYDRILFQNFNSFVAFSEKLDFKTKQIRPNFIPKFQEICFLTHESTFRL